MNHSMSSNMAPKLVGAWNLVSFYAQDPSGQTGYPFGRKAQGRLIYEPNGRMAVQLMNPGGLRPEDRALVKMEQHLLIHLDHQRRMILVAVLQGEIPGQCIWAAGTAWVKFKGIISC